MIKRVILLLLLLLSLAAPTLAAEPGSGTIEGEIVNKTAGGSSVAGQDVTLTTYQNDAEVGTTTASADAEGHFVFDGLSTEPDYRYQVTLKFQEVDYSSEWLSFDEGEVTKSTKIAVYEPTTSNEAIRIATAHTIVYVGQGSFEIVEFYLFVNESDRTYVGSEEVRADGKRETLRFILPEKAGELQPRYGLMECCIFASEDGFIDTMPVLPGTREIAYSYRLDYSSGTYDFSQKVNYPLANFDLMVQGEASRITGDRLMAKEPAFIEEAAFTRASGSDFAPGDVVTAQLSGLRQPGKQGAAIWVLLTLLVLGAGLGSLYLRRRRVLQPVRGEVNPQQSRQELLIELAQLDDDFENGDIPEESYRKLRAEKKAQLIALMRLPKGDSGQG